MAASVFALVPALFLKVAGERVRRTHAPGVGDEFFQTVEVHFLQPQHDQRHPVIGGRGEEAFRLAEQQRLLLRLVADVQYGDVGPDDPRLTWSALGVGPDESFAGDAEIEAVAVDLDHMR
jgi:hypothetical protein